jgi:hypothetical protein
MKDSEVLKAVADLFKKTGHAKGKLATDETGDSYFSPNDKRAVTFCLRGGIMKVCGLNDDMNGFDKVQEFESNYIIPAMSDKDIDRARRNCYCDSDSVVGFNNDESTTTDDLVTLLDAAHILALQSEGIEPEDVFGKAV